MNPEIKAKWIAALTSGEYEQTRNYLRRVGGGYCCLGVLCEVMDPGQWYDGMTISSYVGKHVPVEADLFISFPPAELLDAADLKYTEAQTLAILNDKEGASFEQIAQHIQERL